MNDDDIRTLALLTVRWAMDASHAMSKVAPDSDSFGRLYDRWDAIERGCSSAIRAVLADEKEECSICRRRHGLEVIHACE